MSRQLRAGVPAVAGGLVAALLAASGAGAAGPAPADPGGDACAEVIVYNVRGSGEEPRTGPGADPFDPEQPWKGYTDTWDAFDPIDPGSGGSSIAAGLDYAESGTKTAFMYDLVQRVNQRVGGQVDLSWAPIRYPAIPTPSGIDVVTYLKRYGASLASGVQELARTLKAQWDHCGTRTRYVLTGYSQGADVVHTYLVGQIEAPRDEVKDILFRDFLKPTPEIARQIAAVALIADPNHDRDQESFTHVDPALAGNGGLKAGSPPLAPQFVRVTDSFCFAGDAVCGNGIAFWPTEAQKKHSTWYLDLVPGDRGGKAGVEHPVRCRYPGSETYDASALECAADRIVNRLGLRNLVRDPVDGSEALPGTTGLDVVFMIDTTGSMTDDIDAATRFARQAADRIAALDGRVALVEYRDHEDDVPVRIVTDLTEDQFAFRSGLDSLYADGGGDDPEGLLHALMHAFDNLDWRDGAAKATVVLTDASFHAPDRTGGETVAQVAARSLEIDPVNVFPVVSSSFRGHVRLAEETSGEVVRNSGDTVDSLFTALDRIEKRPIALLDRTTYFAAPGRSIAFDAGRSSAFDASIVDYAWDWDADGVYDATTTSPTATHTFPDGSSGLMQVRVTDSQGRFSNASARVRVDAPATPPADLPAPADDVTATASLVGQQVDVAVAWRAGTEPTRWVATLDGAVLATVPGDQREATFRVPPLEEETVVAVYPMLADGSTGSERATTLPRLVPPPAEPAWRRPALLGGLVASGLSAVLSVLLLVGRRRAGRIAG